MNHLRLTWCGVILALAARPAMPAPVIYPVTAGQVAAIAIKAGLQVSPGQVTLLTAVATTTPTPSLSVRSIERWADHGLLLRVECENRNECLPFYAGIQVNRSTEEPHAGSRSEQPIRVPSSRPASRQFVVQNGAPATLVLDSARVHITLPVICLENGAAGQTIRVRTRDCHMVYTAQVIDGSLLKGRF